MALKSPGFIPEPESFAQPKQNPVRVALKGLEMLISTLSLRRASFFAYIVGSRAALFCYAGVLALSLGAFAQQPAPATPPPTPTPTPDATQPPTATQPPATTPDNPQSAPATPTPAPTTPVAKAEPPQEPGITEEELKQMLVGKPLYLRGGYLDNSLSFGEHGTLIGHSPQGSYTLSAIEIDRVRLTKHKVELEGARYGLHFLGALPYEDPTKALDRVKITPKKKVVRITIDRELVVIPKKKKENEKAKDLKAKAAAPAPKPATAATPTDSAAAASQSTPPATVPTEQATATPAQPASDQSAQAATQTPAAPTATAPAATAPKEVSAEDEAKAEMAAASAEERPADPSSVTTTISPAHATKVLKDALDKMFAPGLDDRMMTAMPDFWKLYYQAVAAKSDYRPADPNVLRQNTVDKKAALVSRFEPESNEWAQASGVAGMALYHTVIGADGKPGEIAVARPIGFGLDENAVAAIRKATFEPAVKDGKPVPVLLDLVVQFRIYSKRTSITSKQEAAEKGTSPQLPGPYTVRDHTN
jgi:outer membrane biosynthesis protein TonB